MSLTNIAILLSLCFIGTFAQKCPTFKPQASFDATQVFDIHDFCYSYERVYDF